MAQFALKWILMNDKISVVIPGATKTSQIESNLAAPKLPDLSADQMNELSNIYQQYVKPIVQHLW